MRGTLLLESVAALACAVGGVRLWQAEPGAEGPAPAPRRSGDDGARGDAPLAAADGTNSAAIAEDDASSRAAGSGRADAPAAVESSTPPADPLPPSRRRPRAPPSATVALPELAAATSSTPRIPEVLARAALKFVGRDPAAEEMWAAAINQPDLPPEARSDLIEDLNDEGYPDANHYTPADLPLILERLRIVERHAPHAMDDVNAAAFAEAYKDLIDMLIDLRGGSAR